MSMTENNMSFHPSFRDVQVVSDGGYEKGYADGSSVGYAECVSEWDMFLQNQLTVFKNTTLMAAMPNSFTGKTLEIIDLKINAIYMGAFENTSKLKALVLRHDGVVFNIGLSFSGSAIAKGTGYIYVPDAFVDEYKAESDWSKYASQIRPLSEYVEE